MRELLNGCLSFVIESIRWSYKPFFNHNDHLSKKLTIEEYDIFYKKYYFILYTNISRTLQALKDLPEWSQSNAGCTISGSALIQPKLSTSEKKSNANKKGSFGEIYNLLGVEIVSALKSARKRIENTTYKTLNQSAMVKIGPVKTIKGRHVYYVQWVSNRLHIINFEALRFEAFSFPIVRSGFWPFLDQFYLGTTKM